MVRFYTSEGGKIIISGGLILETSKIGDINTEVTINENAIIRAIPTDFLGLTYYLGSNSTFFNLAESSLIPYNLLTNLGTGTLRIQGDGGFVWGSNIDETAVDTMKTILNPTNWSITWMINFKDYDPTLYAQEAAYVYSVFGPKLLAIEIGNEPDLYISHNWRPSGYSITDYMTEWLSYQEAIHELSPSCPLTAPSASLSTWMQQFVTAGGAQYVQFLNLHMYPANASAPTDYQQPTISNLLSRPLKKRVQTFLNTCKNIGTTAGKDVVLMETNSISGSGTDGVSNAFGEAIWAVDYAFDCLEYGMRRINFQCAFLDTTSFYYNPIDASGNPLPLYYGVLVFHNAAPDGVCVSSVCTSNIDIVPHATVDSDSKLRVTLVNKDLDYDAYTEVSVQGTYSTASVYYLEAPSITSKTGITFAGNSVASDGSFTLGNPDSLTISNKKVQLTVPKGSVALIVFSE